ncbi:MAG TPA: hypothetical protein VFQ61_09340 [Polyangiaceae bacterium]|nr:hypothetical protein [Polyangiaceae bacterium]
MKARWLCVGLQFWVVTASMSAHAAEVAVSEEARAHFSAGVNLLQDPDGARYEEAYREFRAAYAASPSWKILGNLGITAMKLERDGEAIEAFARYLSEGGKQLDPEERAQTERDLQTLKTGVVRIAFNASRTGARLVDERSLASGSSVVNRYGPIDSTLEIGVRAGHHRITASLAGFKDIVLELDAEPQQRLVYPLEFQAADAVAIAPPPMSSSNARSDVLVPGSSLESDRRPLLRTLSYAAFGVGVVGIGAGTWLALSAKSRFDDANEMCPEFPCYLTQAQQDRRNELGDSGQSRKTLSLVGFVVGGVGLATGATLLVLGTRQNEKTASRPPEVWVGPSSLGMRGQF